MTSRRVDRRPIALWIAGVAALLAVSVAGFVALNRPAYPRPGDHWHAAFLLEICGDVMAPFPPFSGPVHSHGDGPIHIHPRTEAEGRLATLEGFFAEAGGAITRDTLRLPGGAIYRTGDRCPNGERAELLVVINRRLDRDGYRRVLRDGDEVRVIFAP